MKIATFLIYLLSSSVLTMPAYAYVFKDTVQCSHQKLGKPTTVDKCIREGMSTRGYSIFTISWSDGVKNKIQGSWDSLNDWTLDGYPARLIKPFDVRNSDKTKCLQSQVSNITICWWRNQTVKTPILLQENTQASQRLCIVDQKFELASSKFRTVKLYHYGIEVDIPSNYRSIKEQDGSVKIIHPNYFAVFQCIKNGGRGGQGYESLDINLIDRDSSMSLKKQAVLAVGYKTNIRGEKEPTEVEIFNYQVGEIAGYIVISKIGQSYVFIGLIRGSNKIIQVSSNGSYRDFIGLLSRLKLIK